jgi:predicted permease
MLETAVHDVRYAVRWLRRSPGFAAVAILSLGLGIGFTTAIFAVVDALLLRPLPVAAPDRLVDVYTNGSDGDRHSTSSYPDYLDLAAGNEVFSGMAAYSPMFAAVNHGGRSRLTMGEVVTANYFQVLGVPAALGRTFVAGDDAPGAARVAMIAHHVWLRDFGGDPSAVGRTLKIKGHAYEVVGVLPPRFTGMVPMLLPEIWIPVRQVEDVEPSGIQEMTPSPTGTSRIDRRGQRWMFMRARLKDGAAQADAQANLDVLMARLRAEHPQTNKDRTVALVATRDVRVHPDADGLLRWGLLGTLLAVSLVLLIACANVAGMLLARASARHKEVALRLAVGASRGRLVQQLVTESVVLALAGAVVGVLLAAWAIQAIGAIPLPVPVPLSLDLRLDTRVMAAAVAAALATGLLAGLAPALRASRPALASDLKGDAPAAEVGGRRWSLRDGLVAAQIAVTALLLVTSGLLVRSLLASERAELGFRRDGVAIVSFDLSMSGYDVERAGRFFDEAERRVRALPGVDGFARASRTPFSINYNRTNVAVPGVQQAADELGTPTQSADVSPGYFEALGIPLLDGRAFTAGDRPDTPRVAVINESMARKYWPGRSAVGQRVHQRTLSGAAIEIVGVVADHKLQTVGEPAQPAIHFAIAQRPTPFGVLVASTRGDATALLTALRETLLGLEPELLFLDNQTMAAQVDATLFPVRAAAFLVALFSGTGLLLAAMGLYGVIAYAVARRTREIGIRIALGAEPGGVLRMVMRQGLTLAAAGWAVGVLLAVAAAQTLAAQLYGISAGDPVAWGGAAVVLLAVAVLANALPARRAARIDPVVALRME